MRKKKALNNNYETKSTVANILDIVIKNIIINYKPDSIILFGLYSYKNTLERSMREAAPDLDLLIIKEDEELSKLDIADRSLFLNKYISGLNKVININTWVFTPKEIKQRKKAKDLFINYIFEKHKVLYKNQEALAAVA